MDKSETDLRLALHQEVGDIGTRRDLTARAMRGGNRRRRTRKAALGVVALVAIGGGAVSVHFAQDRDESTSGDILVAAASGTEVTRTVTTRTVEARESTGLGRYFEPVGDAVVSKLSLADAIESAEATTDYPINVNQAAAIQGALGVLEPRSDGTGITRTVAWQLKLKDFQYPVMLPAIATGTPLCDVDVYVDAVVGGILAAETACTPDQATKLATQLKVPAPPPAPVVTSTPGK